jgi:hypothetical protein
MRAFGRHYPPFLQEAVDHAQRLVELLQTLDPRAARRSAATWLVGRVGEVECLVGELVDDWQRGAVSEADAAGAVNAYVGALHRGLAINFGELAPSCCVQSIIVTATPASFLSTTRSFPRSVGAASIAPTSTWAEVQEAELIVATRVSGCG